MVWAKIMALGLDGNWRGELLRLRLAKKIGDESHQIPDRFAGRRPRRHAVDDQRGAERARSRPPLSRHRQFSDAQARGLERMGPVRRAFGVGQAAARQRPASGARLPRHLVSRAAGRTGLRHPRRHLAGLARRRARPQRHDRLGLHHHQPRQPGPVRRAGRSDRSRPLPDAGRRAPVRRARGDDQRAVGRSRCACACAARVTAW